MAKYSQHPIEMSQVDVIAGVTDQTQAYSTAQVVEEVEDLCRRGVLVEAGDAVRCKVPLLSEWLVTGGARQILITFDDLTEEDENHLREEKAEIRPEEIQKLLETWDSFRGHKITSDDIRQWLGQFGSKTNQRLMYHLLRAVKFYGRTQIREKLAEAHSIVTRNTSRVIEGGQRRRRDILVSYFGGVAKSSAQYANLYADENQILKENVVERDKLRTALKRGQRVSALVFVDDFVGTGGSVKNALNDLDKEVVRKLRREGTPMFFIALAGFREAEAKLIDAASGLDVELSIHFCDVFSAADKAFADEAGIFPDSASREEARKLAFRRGQALVSNNPLGYGRGEALVVFESGCPNNSLPILWAKTPAWKPLFPRL